MGSPESFLQREFPAPGLSGVDLIRGPRREDSLWGGVLSDLVTGAASRTGDLSKSLEGLGSGSRDRAVALGIGTAEAGERIDIFAEEEPQV
jgi:hypothetical protein